MGAVLVTGANGFVGKALCSRLMAEDYFVRAAVRSPERAIELHSGVEPVFTGSLDDDTDWSAFLQNVDMVVHLAARVHVMRETATDPLAAFRRANVEGTVRLVQAAIAAGTKRFVFLSSIGVNGNASPPGRAFSEQDEPAPHNYYSQSKLEAEQEIRKISAGSKLETVIVRAPLVYGPGNPGNFLRLLHVVRKGIPLPFASVKNCRSLIYLDNLVDALITCCRSHQAVGNTYLVSDGEDVSTPELIRRIAFSLGREALLVPFPPSIMFLAGGLLGKRPAVERLIGSLAVDSSKIVRELGWTAPYTMAQGLQATAEWYKEQFKI